MMLHYISNKMMAKQIVANFAQTASFCRNLNKPVSD
jgi:hypothetical protein